MLEQVPWAIVEKGGGIVVVIVDGNALVDKYNIVQTAIGKRVALSN